MKTKEEVIDELVKNWLDWIKENDDILVRMLKEDGITAYCHYSDDDLKQEYLGNIESDTIFTF